MIRFSPNPNSAHLIRWLEWDSEAFAKAQEQDKPVMLYIGAFWCGFCQSMDETTFSTDEIITLLNAYFVPVRVENAQRPDIDVRYNQNGWPTIVFMTPQGVMLASVNYLPPDDFASVLVRVHQAYQEQKDALAEADQEASQTSTRANAQGKMRASAVSEISNVLMELADDVHGGYGPDHKFLHPEASDFLLYRYETTGDTAYLDHVTLTLDRMRDSKTHDDKDSGFFRYSSKADWSEPHREKLLADHAGLLGNYLRIFLLTDRPVYRQMAEEIIGFLNSTLSDPSGAAFYGCQDYLRVLVPRKSGTPGYDPRKTFSVVDDLIYTDANAQTVSAYLEASWVLGRPDCKERAIRTLDFLWKHCRALDGGMCHYYDGEPHAPGLLVDQVYMGAALLDAYRLTGESRYLEQATELGEAILASYVNPAGGFFDIREKGLAHLRFPLTLLVENGVAASFFLRLGDFTEDKKYRQAALWALNAFTGDFGPYGVYASGYGRALAGYISSPLRITLEGQAGDPALITLARAVLTRLGHFRLILSVSNSTAQAAIYIERDSGRIGPIYDAESIMPEMATSP
ncbi:MAG: thioredoxin domain-containing protein [Chloroflexi bacterium]|nr:thioredoxin domain-containing protein [Chloroflexota bacterium]